MQDRKVCIVGAGVGGLATGAILSKKGFDVTIFEKEPFVGGRAASLQMSSLSYKDYINILNNFNIDVPFSEPSLETIFEKNMLDGYSLDLGFHIIGGGIIHNLAEILSLPKSHIKMLKSRLYEQKNDHFGFFIPTIEKLKILHRILRLFFASERTMKKFDEMTMTEVIKKYGRGRMKLILEVNSRLITTVNNLDRISAGEVFRATRAMRLKGVRYPVGGLYSIAKKLADFIKDNGGKIILNKKVEEIIVEDGKAKGVVVEDNEYLFDAVIVNTLVKDLFGIVDEREFPKDYVKNIKSLTGTGSLCAYYSFRKIKSELINKSFVFIERDAGIDGNDAAGMIDFMVSSPESLLSPSSQHLVQSYIICNPDEARNKKILEKLKEILDSNMERIMPNYQSNLNWAIYPTVWHLDGVAKTIDNIKPEIKTPVENLYLVGDCVKAPGVGMNCAINSARILQKIIK